MKYSKESIDAANKVLRERIDWSIPPIATVKSVSRSGMSRKIAFSARGLDGNDYNVTHQIAVCMGLSMDRDLHAIKIAGGGMDMIFHILYGLAEGLNGVNGMPDPLHVRYNMI
jgi:hypothetical protein